MPQNAKGIALALYDTNQLAWDVTTENDGIELADAFLQRCMSYFRSIHVTATLEARGRIVVNSFKAASTCGNKLVASICLSKAKIPTPRTFITYTQEASLKALEQLGYPAVLKPIVGSWGRLVAQIKDPESAIAILEPREYMHPVQQVYYLQEKIKRPERRHPVLRYWRSSSRCNLPKRPARRLANQHGAWRRSREASSDS